MQETLLDLQARRSCRSYLPTQVSRETLDAILTAGTYAPSGRNQQSPVMVVIQDKELIAKLGKLNAQIMNHPELDPFYGAPTVVVVFADRQSPTYVADGNLVLGNLFNAAQALGVNSCYIYRAKEEFETGFGQALLKKWGLPDTYEGIGHCILGYAAPGGVKPASPRKADYIIYA